MGVEANELLIPCPFCGGGETLIKENHHWTGRSSIVISVTLNHWCSKQDDTFIIHTAHIRARTKEQAIEAWNKRSPL